MKRKISILFMSLILLITSMPNFAYAEITNWISDFSDTSIEKMAEEELNGEEPEAETENS